MLPSFRQSQAPGGPVLSVIGAILLLVSSIAYGASSELPDLGESALLNIERETSLGRTVYDKLMAKGLIETHPLLDRYINDLGFRLLAGLDNRVRDYRFFIVRDDSVNAFALPGGFIGVNRGLIMQARTQHQLASVMAHEIAHVRLMHGLDLMKKGSQMSNAALLSVLAGLLLGGVDSQLGSAVLYGGAAGTQQAMVNFTRENEYEADRLGIELMQSAQFDPNGMVEFFSIMANLSGTSELGNIEYLRTHPVNNNRIAEAMGRVRKSSLRGERLEDYQLFKDYLLYASSDHLTDRGGSEYLQALVLMRAARYQDADARLAELYSRDNENIWYSIAFAENLEYLRREDEAELVYRRLLDIFPEDYVLSMRLLRLLKLEGRNQSALVIARSLEIQYPDDKQVYFELSEIYQSLQRPALRMMAQAEFHRIAGNPQQAIRLYDQVLDSPDTDIATESKAREKRLQLLQQQK
ncbi:MAG: M48 family metalloprotease [Gammaproteobacteria bacterium]|nr:M48 family metalloprotease [Gammaproteobacteria bacterium]MDH3448510.1 M48 family metalloprotease [Gammaproteobacteria bacterium]